MSEKSFDHATLRKIGGLVFSTAETAAAVAAADLSERERTVVQLHHGAGIPRATVAARYNISTARAGQIERRALAKIRYHLVSPIGRRTRQAEARGNGASPNGHDSPALERLELGVRTYNCLKRAGIMTLADLAAQTYPQLMGINNLGKGSMEEIEKALAAHGAALAERPTSVTYKARISALEAKMAALEARMNP